MALEKGMMVSQIQRYHRLMRWFAEWQAIRQALGTDAVCYAAGRSFVRYMAIAP
jgi:hypothetical protein